MTNPKLIRITTIPLSLDKLLGEQLRFMSQFYKIKAVSSDEKELKKVAEKYEVNYHSIEMTRTISPVQDIVSVWKMYRFLKKEKPEMVHTHTPKAGIIGMTAAYFAGVPIRLHTVAGLPLMEANGTRRMILNQVEKLTYSCATKVYPNSKGLADFIIREKFCHPSKLKIIANGSSNGIDLSHFSPTQIPEKQKTALKNQLGISENDFVFVFVGRLVKDKGINELVSALKNLNHSTTQPFKLLLVGNFEPKLDPLLPQTLNEIEQNPNIISVGFQDDVRPYFAIANALVFPSYREGFPNVVLQAGAMELPSIVTDINGCNEIVENNKNGLIIPTKNTTALKLAMEELMQNIELRQKLKNNSRSMIESRYDQQQVWKSIKKEYEQLLTVKRLLPRKTCG